MPEYREAYESFHVFFSITYMEQAFRVISFIKKRLNCNAPKFDLLGKPVQIVKEHLQLNRHDFVVFRKVYLIYRYCVNSHKTRVRAILLLLYALIWNIMSC
jgi:hypothetical protein